MIRLSRRSAPMKRSAPLRRGNKFGAVKTLFGGRLYDSKGEAARGAQLIQLERAGLIRDLCFQVRFPLIVNGQTVRHYRADFVYQERDARDRECWSPVLTVEDFKGVRTDTYRLKAKLMKALHGYTVKETTRNDLRGAA